MDTRRVCPKMLCATRAILPCDLASDSAIRSSTVGSSFVQDFWPAA